MTVVVDTPQAQVLTFTVPDNTCKTCEKSLSICDCKGPR